MENGTSSENKLIEFLYPGPDCGKLCVAGISIGLIIVTVGSFLFCAAFACICWLFPSAKAERAMRQKSKELRKEWDDVEAQTTATQPSSVPVKTRKQRNETAGDGTNRSSSFYHVRFKDRSRTTSKDNGHHIEMGPVERKGSSYVEMQRVDENIPLMQQPDVESDSSESLHEVIERDSSLSINPLRRSVVIADVVIEPICDYVDHQTIDTPPPQSINILYDLPPVDEEEEELPQAPTVSRKVIEGELPPTAEKEEAEEVKERQPVQRWPSYDEVFETPRSSMVFLPLAPSHLNASGYLSDEEYLDARSTLANDEESDSDRTLTFSHMA